MTNFKPGDMALWGGERVSVKYGPFKDWSGPSNYVVATESEGAWSVPTAKLEPIPPADPRVDVVAAAAYESRVNRTWSEASDVAGDLWRETARAVLAALDAHATQSEEKPPRRVRDRDGDEWERNASNTWDGIGVIHFLTGWADERLTRMYGPLTTLED